MAPLHRQPTTKLFEFKLVVRASVISRTEQEARYVVLNSTASWDNIKIEVVEVKELK